MLEISKGFDADVQEAKKPHHAGIAATQCM